MRKLFFISTLLVSGLMATAQSEYKFAAGSNNLEVNFTPLGGAPISINNIKFRKFISENTAYRLGLGLNYSSNSVEKDALTDVNVWTEMNKVTSTLGINLRPGVEKHFAGTDRLSPYVGAELDIALQSNTVNTEYWNATDKRVETNTSKGNGSGFWRMGANAVAGCDYYFAKKIYLGAELGFGMQYKHTSATTVTDTDTKLIPTSPNKRLGSGGDFSFGPNFVSAIRLGFLF